MKRIAYFVMVALFLSSICFAEGIDISGLSDSELLNLKDKVEAEISARNVGSIFTPWKEYCAGRFLPDPSIVLGKDTFSDYGLHINDANSFVDTFIAEDDNEFFTYCEACIAAGFSEVSDMSKISFKANSPDGKKLNIFHFTEKCQVDLDIEQ